MSEIFPNYKPISNRSIDCDKSTGTAQEDSQEIKETTTLVKCTLDGWFSINWSFPMVYSDH